MMDEREHEAMRSLLAPYVLGAVPDDEMRLVRSHLLSCDECMAETDRLSEVGEAMALSVEPVEVPSDFSARVMAQVQAERPVVAESVRARSSFWSRVPAFGMAALLIVSALLGVALYKSNQSLDARTDALRRLLPGDGMKLHGPGSLAAVVPDNDGALFVAEGLPDLPSDRVYQLWLMKGDCEPGGSGACEIVGFNTFTASDGLTVIRVEESLEGYSRAAVTVEPEGGSSQPTSDPVIDSAVA